MIRVLAWKEYREHRTVWAALAVVTVLVLVGVARLEHGSHDARAVILLTTSSLLSCVVGIVYGALLFAGEREEGTLGFLDSLPSARRQIWQAKALTGAALVLGQVVVALATDALLHGLAGGYFLGGTIVVLALGWIGLSW